MVEKRKFGAKMGAGHWIGHIDDESGVGRVVCIKHRDFGETNRNTNYLSVVVCLEEWFATQVGGSGGGPQQRSMFVCMNRGGN